MVEVEPRGDGEERDKRKDEAPARLPREEPGGQREVEGLQGQQQADLASEGQGTEAPLVPAHEHRKDEAVVGTDLAQERAARAQEVGGGHHQGVVRLAIVDLPPRHAGVVGRVEEAGEGHHGEAGEERRRGRHVQGARLQEPPQDQ